MENLEICIAFLIFFVNKCGIGWSAVEYMGGSAGGEGATLGLLHIHGFLDVIASLPDVIIPQINICHNHNTSVIVPLVVSQGMIPMKKPEFFVEEILNSLKRNQTKV